MALINFQQIKHGPQLVSTVDNAVSKSAIITEPSEVPSDELIPSEAYMQRRLTALTSNISTCVEESLSMISSTPVEEFTLPSIPTNESVTLIINGISYQEGKDFTVDRTTGKITWTGDFPLTVDTVDEMRALYTTLQPRQDGPGGSGGSGGFPAAKHVVGMVLVHEGISRADHDSGYEGTWARVDQNFNAVDFDPEHGTWAGIHEVPMDENEFQKFIEIPTTWVKSEKLSSGPYAGCNCWWIADGEVPGFHVHPAFIKSDGTPGTLRVAQHVTLVPNQYGDVVINDTRYSQEYITYNEVRAKGLAYNTDGKTGYRAYSIYDHHFLVRMMLVENGGPNIQYSKYHDNWLNRDEWYKTMYLADTVLLEQAPPEGVQQAAYNYHGIEGVLGDFYSSCLLDGLTTLNGTYQVLAPNGSGQMIETGVACPNGGIWPINCRINTVNGVNFGDIFINDGRNEDTNATGMSGSSYIEGVSIEDQEGFMANGSFSDYQFIVPDKALQVHYEEMYAYSGMFLLNSISPERLQACWRLVQVV